jgi:flagellar hook assembly protein FlgD
VRKPFAALVAGVLAVLGALAPAAAPVAHAATTTKVAIIVGATHDVTPRYRSYADEIAATARKYTSNVVKVYSPNATASRVKTAVSGASIIVYLGHGNGWPSPYTYDPNYTTKDGFGLNYDANGNGKTTDYENKYYGEPWIRDLNPAPNAVVLLFHLCYASGNPEGGAYESSSTRAKQRVDNYAAAFLRAGARAVIANGHSHAPYYIDALFNTRQTIDAYWRNAPDANDRFTPVYGSSRTPGYSYVLDPERTGYYFRSIAGKLSLRTQDVTGAPYADTSADPKTMVVPGNASPVAAGAPLYPSIQDAQAATNPVTILTPDTKVRVDAKETATTLVGGSPIYRVHTDAAEGWATGPALVPRDSAAPRTWEVDSGAGTFSPNGDGTQDDLSIGVRMSESASWTMRVTDGDGTELDHATGTSDVATITWAPAAGSVADGTYRWTLEATDGWGNGPLEDEGTFLVDTTSPEVSVAEAEGDVPQFSPNGDGVSDTVRFAVDASEPGTVSAVIRDEAGDTVDSTSVSVGTSGGTVSWDGKDADGAYAPDGTYTLSFVARDRAGNRSDAQTRDVLVYASLAFVATSRAVFFPQDLDALVPSTALSFRLAAAATVTWTIQDAEGTVVRTIATDQPMDPGTPSFTWDGRADDGTMVPRGTYRSVVTATDGTLAVTGRVSVVADAFATRSSDTTPARRQRITITTTSAENLKAAPKLRVYQPGVAGWTVTMTKVATRVYRVTITLKGGSAGTVRFKVSGTDSGGRSQSSVLALAIH